MSKIKALYVSPVPNFKGGAEHSLFDLLANPGVDPVLAVPAEGELADRARSLGIKVEVVNFGAVHNVQRPFKFSSGLKVMTDAWRAAGSLKEIVSRNAIEIVHTNGLKAHSIAVLMRLRSTAKIVMHFRDIAYTRQEKLVWQLLAFSGSRAVYVSAACCPDERMPSNGRVIFNGVDPRPAIVRNPSSPLRVGFIGRIHPHKGLHVLLDWLHYAKGKGVSVHLLIRGRFSQEAPDYESEIKAKIEAYGLGESVEFQGFISDPEKVYDGLDVICAPAQAAEPLGRTILEPLNMGLPVIATLTGGTREMILPNVTGFAVHSAEEFYTAIQTIQSEPKTIDAMVDAGRDHISANFSKRKLHQSICELYQELLPA